jgi:TonB family protein
MFKELGDERSAGWSRIRMFCMSALLHAAGLSTLIFLQAHNIRFDGSQVISPQIVVIQLHDSDTSILFRPAPTSSLAGGTATSNRSFASSESKAQTATGLDVPSERIYEASSLPMDLEILEHVGYGQEEALTPSIAVQTSAFTISNAELSMLPVPEPADMDRGKTVQSPLISPKPIRWSAPEYPEVARLARVQGLVTLEAKITTVGRIDGIRVISGHPLLIGAAVECVKQWRYRPAVLHNEQTTVPVLIEIRFTLTEKG